jgi:hypothetical protein
MATLPAAHNQTAIENHVLSLLHDRVLAAGFQYLSTLIEDRLRNTGPAWFRNATALEQIDDYLHSGVRFSYFQVVLQTDAG